MTASSAKQNGWKFGSNKDWDFDRWAHWIYMFDEVFPFAIWSLILFNLTGWDYELNHPTKCAIVDMAHDW